MEEVEGGCQHWQQVVCLPHLHYFPLVEVGKLVRQAAHPYPECVVEGDDFHHSELEVAGCLHFEDVGELALRGRFRHRGHAVVEVGCHRWLGGHY